MKKEQTNGAQDGVNRRFFAAVGALVRGGRMKSLSGFIRGCGLTPSRYRELRLQYGEHPSRRSRYTYVEVDALARLCVDYGVSADWLLTGRGQMLEAST